MSRGFFVLFECSGCFSAVACRLAKLATPAEIRHSLAAAIDDPGETLPCNVAGGEECTDGTVCSETDPAATGATCVGAPRQH